MHPSWDISLQGFEQIAAASKNEIAADQPLKFEGGKIVLFQGTSVQDVTLSTQEPDDHKTVMNVFRDAIREKMGVLPETFFEASHDPSLGFFSKESEDQALEHGLTPNNIKQVFEEIDKTPRAIKEFSVDKEEIRIFFEWKNPVIAEPESFSCSIAERLPDVKNQLSNHDIHDQSPITNSTIPDNSTKEVQAIQITDTHPTHLINLYNEKKHQAISAGKNALANLYSRAEKAAETARKYQKYLITEVSDVPFYNLFSLLTHEQLEAARFYARAAEETDAGNEPATAYWSTAAKSYEQLADYRINLAIAKSQAAQATDPDEIKEWNETADLWNSVITSQEKAATHSLHAAEMQTSGKWLSAFFSSIAASWWKSIADWQAWYASLHSDALGSNRGSG